MTEAEPAASARALLMELVDPLPHRLTADHLVVAIRKEINPKRKVELRAEREATERGHVTPLRDRLGERGERGHGQAMFLVRAARALPVLGRDGVVRGCHFWQGLSPPR